MNHKLVILGFALLVALVGAGFASPPTGRRSPSRRASGPNLC